MNAVYVGSNDEIVSKVMSGGGAADLISPSNDTTMRLINADAVSPIDASKVPNMADFFEQFKQPPWLVKDGQIYGVPYGWGIIRIIADAKAVDPKTDSLAFLWDPKYAGKISVWDDIETVYMAGRLLGVKDVYNMTDEELEKVKAKLIEMKPNIRKYWFTTGEMGSLMAANEVVAGNSWESTLVELRKAGREIVDIKPKEGRGGWSDSWMIVKGAEDNPCVYQWLNYVSSPKAQALAHGVTGFGYSNMKLAGELDEATRKVYHGPRHGQSRQPQGRQLVAARRAARQVPRDLEPGEGRQLTRRTCRGRRRGMLRRLPLLPRNEDLMTICN